MEQVSKTSSGLADGMYRMFASLGVRDFRMLWTGMLFSMAAMQINIVARSWLAFDMSGSALILGVVAAARSLPQLILAPIGGVAADRFDKRRLLLISQSLLAVLALINAVLVHLGVIEIWQLIVIGLFQGTLNPFTMPTRTAFAPDLVGEKLIPNALALDSTGRNINRIVAPSIAGIMIAINPTIAFYTIAIMYFAAVVTLFQLPSGYRGGAGGKNAFAEMGTGFSYIWNHRQLLALMVMAFIIVILGMPFQQLLPVFQSDVLHVGPRELGFMFTAVGLGAIIGSLVAAYLAESPNIARLQMASAILFGLSLILFGLASWYPLSLLMLLVVGFASQGYLTLNRMMVIMQTDRALYGRVMSIYMMTWSLVPAALLPIGIIVDQVGVSITVAVSGLLLAIVTVIISAGFSRIYLRKIPQQAAS